MCGSSGGGGLRGLFSGLTSGATPPAYTPHEPLTYVDGQWTQGGKPVNPAGGITPTPPGLGGAAAGGGASAPPQIPSAPPPAPTSILGNAAKSALGGGASGAPPSVSPPPGVGQNNFASIFGSMAKGFQRPTSGNQDMAGQGHMPVAPAGVPMGGSSSNSPQMQALIQALLAKRGA